MERETVIVMNQFLLPYGNDKIAAMGIASKVSMIAQLVLVGFSFGGIPLFGYLYGAKKRDVMRKLIRFCLTFLVSIAVVLSLVLCLNSGALMRLFVQDAGMIATGAQMLRWQVYTAAFGGVVLLLTVLFQATGKIVPSFLLSISRQGVVFLLALVVCVHLFQYQGVLMAQAVADTLRKRGRPAKVAGMDLHELFDEHQQLLVGERLQADDARDDLKDMLAHKPWGTPCCM